MKWNLYKDSKPEVNRSLWYFDSERGQLKDGYAEYYNDWNPRLKVNKGKQKPEDKYRIRLIEDVTDYNYYERIENPCDNDKWVYQDDLHAYLKES